MQGDEGPASVTCKISMDIILDGSDLSAPMQARYKIFSSIFEDVEGSSISQKDRMKAGDLDVPNFTYGEIGDKLFLSLDHDE